MITNTELKNAKTDQDSLVGSRKNQILDAAIIVFSKDGFAGASTDLIAEKAGLGKGTLYRYFENKEQLFLSAVDRGLEKLREAMFNLKEISNPLEKLEAAIRTYLTFHDNNPALVDMQIHEQSTFGDRIRDKYLKHYYGNVDKMKQTFRNAIDLGLIKNIDIDGTMSILTSILNGLIYAWHIEGKKYKLSSKIPIACKVFFTGIVKDEKIRGKYE
jgi:AcrR family transcriptional regulator